MMVKDHHHFSLRYGQRSSGPLERLGVKGEGLYHDHPGRINLRCYPPVKQKEGLEN